MSQPTAAVYVLPAWRPGPDWPVAVGAVVDALRGVDGRVPRELDEPHALAFAGASRLPLADLDIEPALFVPNRRWASRAYIREHYPAFRAFCGEHGWLTDGELTPAAEPLVADGPDINTPPEAPAAADPPAGTHDRPKRVRKRVAA